VLSDPGASLSLDRVTRAKSTRFSDVATMIRSLKSVGLSHVPCLRVCMKTRTSNWTLTFSRDKSSTSLETPFSTSEGRLNRFRVQKWLSGRCRRQGDYPHFVHTQQEGLTDAMSPDTVLFLAILLPVIYHSNFLVDLTSTALAIAGEAGLSWTF